MKKKTLLVTCLLLVLIFLGTLIFYKSFVNRPVCAHCNVILISLDTLGANHLPCYGYERNTAPNLCNFAKDNVFFTNFFSNASWTLPSHFSIFTSLYPNHHNMVTFNDKLNSNIPMMAEFFKKADYKTIYVGPTINENLPLDKGTGRGFDTILPLETKDTFNLSNWDKGISQLIKNNSQKKSTFLFLHTYWVHPHNDKSTIPEDSIPKAEINKIFGQSGENVSTYDETIYYLDKKLTKIFDLVLNKKLANNTVIIITSDHGEEFMEHGTLAHPADSVYNTTTTVPLIMYIPGIKQKKVNGLAQSIDILPTVLKLTGIDSIKANFDGIDLTDSIFNRQNAVFNNYLISEGPSIDSIRNKRWKLYVKGNPSGGSLIYELYDLQNDPLEKNNLAQEEPEIIKTLHDNLNRIIYKK